MNRAEALKQGKQVLKMMKTRGWKVHVWHNQYWCVKLVKVGGLFSLNWSVGYGQTKPSDFWTLLSTDHPHAGETFWTPRARRFKDPNYAVRYQLMVANAFIKRCQKIIARSTK